MRLLYLATLATLLAQSTFAAPAPTPALYGRAIEARTLNILETTTKHRLSIPIIDGTNPKYKYAV